MIYFAESFGHSYGGGWAVRSTPTEALRAARQHIGETARTERASYVLEFADDAEPTCASGIYGGWSAKTGPLRVIEKHKTQATDAELMGTV